MAQRVWTTRRFPLAVFGAGLLLFPFAPQARAGEAHFVLVFGCQRIPNDPDFSHSFVTFVRASWPGDCPPPPCPRLETRTISWLPENLVIRPLALCPERGRNFGLHSTLRYVLASGERVSLWGPYQVHPDLYHRAMRQVALLESGQVQYKAVDAGYRSDEVINCIHAVSSLAEGHRLRAASPRWGETASYAILGQLGPWVLDRCRVHPWVGSALGLDAYPIIYRGWESPRSGAIVGPVYRALGGEQGLRPTYGPAAP